MDALTNLGSIGLELPTPTYLFGAIFFGILGYVTFRRGRKASRPELTWTGMALMLYPYAVSQTWLLWAIGFGLSAWVYTKWN